MALRSKPTGTRPMSKAKAKSSTQMVTFSTANTTCHKNMARDYIFGAVITQNIKANLRKTHYKARPAFTSLRMNTTLAGLEMASVMDKELIHMKMATCFMASGRMMLSSLGIISLRMVMSFRASSKIIN